MINEFFKKLNPYQGMIYFWALIGMIVVSFMFVVVSDAQDALDDNRKAVISEILKDYRKVIDHDTYLMVEYNGKKYRYEKANLQAQLEMREAIRHACRRMVDNAFKDPK